jgi:hypothetical protein
MTTDAVTGPGGSIPATLRVLDALSLLAVGAVMLPGAFLMTRFVRSARSRR